MMEEASGATKNLWGEISDSSSSSHHQIPTRHQTSTAGAGAPASRFKGVVSQPNGHWGAQIYANHQRIWLGTFKSEKDAAMAYDSAAMKLRNGLTSRNFPWTDATVREPSFQEQFSTETVLTMIKDGSYASKFSDYTRDQDRHGPRVTALHDAPATRLRLLFEKELTPSDVSKLNRLVIPKKFAVKYFPRISHATGGKGGGSVDDIELLFFDRSMRSWNFRYCYWKSSQSFVFTRGWNRFAKEKGLRSKDRVIFSSYESSGQKFCILDVAYDDINGGRGGPVDEASKTKMKPEDEIERMDRESVEVKENVASPSCKGLKLFGVRIV
ncbi:AP2/ERF and B3 domain-containing transcription factor At1g51120-like [Salvia miltiorrhiza]|uniref:AP2/ERF and B3 domain-containing transcription factor At1g51120-like n=1 Tax=Salvia miltiorrhiza TaxID=226208 RepID=UPI0025ACCBA7|nr:AP2/ERF and B3 domain-containing transcription factor At1g51120-like [Salvia miltiorrhiza]XP_057767148.1 AP2/ERF and B3 domain-containing transcription factor At1g51120-like [Salvia miltiorrhiza]XP_057767149.1 AP2/ERF and B3 domain-containing transcription factor At1g51120-like [Salvia miltiorrhiza]XP_057767150.1 AP2/ERF and B3 domain-containing transcription factor At1g51120-like [Salvia miltiorrhiza]XP_057767151.1 AP2/ERF and B3 domain-containing transcription factor At1g51120-like [Salvia